MTAINTNLANLAASGNTPADATKQLNATFDNFLKLLTTQLKNQDPLSPQDSSQFTSQLVQFSSVEQQIATNTKLDALNNYQKTQQGLQASSYIGHTVEAIGNSVAVTSGDTPKFGVSAPDKLARIDLQITDSSGKVVRTLSESDPIQGYNKFEWDGKDAAGTAVPDGKYTIKATGYDGALKPSDLTTSAYAKVTNVTIDDSGVYLEMNGVFVGLDKVVSVSA
jgi:flagellar basal-body rod modification protein FlgD